MSGVMGLPFDWDHARQAPGFWYLGTPYTDYFFGLDAAAEHAGHFAGLLLLADVQVYSPIVHCHPIAKLRNIDPTDGKFWMAATAAVRRAAFGLIVVEMEGWEESRGLTDEREEFYREGKPIYHLNRVALRRLRAELKRR